MTDEIQIIDTILLTAITAGGAAVWRAVSQIRRALADQTTRVTRLEDFRDSHETWCSERADRNEREHGAMSAAIDINRESLHTFRNDTMRELLKLAPKK